MFDLLDVYEGDPVMAPAFVSFVVFVAGQDETVAAFEDHSGLHLPAGPRSPLDVMIDQATGVDDAYVMAFAAWVYETMWVGEVDDGE